MESKGVLVKLLGILVISIAMVNHASAWGEHSKTNNSNAGIEKQFAEAVTIIRANYFEPVDTQKLLGGAIEGMLSSLDPHSRYLDASALQVMKSTVDGNFGGIGVRFSSQGEFIKVMSVLDGTPAQKAGIKSGDYITAVDGKSLLGINTAQIVDLVRGKAGTKVTLSVFNKDNPKPRTVVLKRAVIDIKSVTSRMLTKGYGLVKINAFDKTTVSSIKKAIRELNKQADPQIKGLVLDLRNNPGGLLVAATGVANLFLNSQKLGRNKKIVYTRSQVKKQQMTANATAGDILAGVPIVVLINHGSASASEIVAGALQDHKRAVLVGQRSFGKGSVQAIIPLANKDSAIKMTTALYYTPDGHSIQAVGIVPDVIVPELQLTKDGDSDQAAFLANMRENSLINSLRNENQTIVNRQLDRDKLLAIKMKRLAQKDYQLYTALSVLKSLSLGVCQGASC